MKLSATKITTFVLFLFFLAVFTGCGGGDTEIANPFNVENPEGVAPSPPPPPPPATETPANLTLTTGEGTINLTWDPVAGATYYNVYMSTTLGGTAAATPLNVGVLVNRTYSPLVYLQDYYFAVTAFDPATGESLPTAELSATPDRVSLSNAIIFPDTGLQNCFTSLSLLPSPILYADEITTSLDCSSSGITALTGIDWLPTTITDLELSTNGITDLSLLSGFTTLTALRLNDNNGLQDISPLSGLTNLNILYLYNANISDLSALEFLNSLTTLNLHTNSITDISPLVGLSNLTDLNLLLNSITTLPADMSGMTSLTKLNLQNNNITIVTPLGDLLALTDLNLQANNDIQDVQAFSTLINIVNLDLQFNDVTTGVFPNLNGLTAAVVIDFQNSTTTPPSAAVCTDFSDLDTALGGGVPAGVVLSDCP